MKDCCKVGPKTKECVRKSDKKTFKFPRRFSKKHCLTKKIKGFTMRASCAPFKGCKKGGNAKKIKGGKFDKHRNIEKDSYEDALDKPELEIPITDDAFYELSDSSYDLNQNIPDVSLNLDDSNLDSTRFSDIANDTSITDLSFDQDEIFENPPSPIRRQRGGGRKSRKKRKRKGRKRKTKKSKNISGGMTPEQQTMYINQLKRLGEIIVKRIEDEIQKAKFLDVFPTMGDMEMLTNLEIRTKSLSELLRQRTLAVGLENVIRELRQIEYNLLEERVTGEQSIDMDYYEIELANFLVDVNKRFPEETMPHLNVWESKQLPDAAGPVGGKRKTRKIKKK